MNAIYVLTIYIFVAGITWGLIKPHGPLGDHRDCDYNDGVAEPISIPITLLLLSAKAVSMLVPFVLGLPKKLKGSKKKSKKDRK